jgi:predicted MFS family arabinose efflux permease
VLLLFHSTALVMAILAVGAVLGLPNGFNNLGLQATLYEATPPDHMGAASGLFQTARYVGAILSTSVLGPVFSTTVTNSGLHLIAAVLAVVSGFLLVATIATRRHSRA